MRTDKDEDTDNIEIHSDKYGDEEEGRNKNKLCDTNHTGFQALVDTAMDAETKNLFL